MLGAGAGASGLAAGDGSVHIGILGHITYLKGARVVAALVREVERRALDVRVTVFGTLDEPITAPCLTVLGDYRRDALPQLIRDSGANLFFFPSIWPETFSMVVQELMLMRLPIAAFRLGAPAERLATYGPASLIDADAVDDPGRTLDALLAFHAGARATTDAAPCDGDGLRYDPAQPLFFIHIPKTAGTSLRRVFCDWFGDGLRHHYIDEQTGRLPERHELRDPATGAYRPGLCVFGHFEHSRGVGLEDYYPDARQRIAFVRDPLAREVSGYDFVRDHPELWKDAENEIAAASLEDYLRRPPSDIPRGFLAPDLTLENLETVLAERFLHIGVSEAIEHSLTLIAAKLGKPPPASVPRLNTSDQCSAIPEGLRAEFLAQRPLEAAVYRYALRLNGLPLPPWLADPVSAATGGAH
jgi:hypothetical protein